jgi:hypothetical protein
MATKETPKDQLSLEERLARLEAAEASLREREKAVNEREESLKAAEDSGAVRPVRPSEAVCVGDGYEFEVSPAKADSTLPAKRIRCCDESEAIRWYVATTASPENAGKQVDPVKHPLRAVCKDPRRDERRKQALLLASLRAKSERGNMLTEEEQAMLDAADMRRAGF